MGFSLFVSWVRQLRHHPAATLPQAGLPDRLDYVAVSLMRRRLRADSRSAPKRSRLPSRTLRCPSSSCCCRRHSTCLQVCTGHVRRALPAASASALISVFARTERQLIHRANGSELTAEGCSDSVPVVTTAEELLLSELETALAVSGFYLHVRWDEQGVELGNVEVAVPAGSGITVEALKQELAAKFSVPVAAQFLCTIQGVALDDEEVLVEEQAVVMCESFSVAVKITEYEQPSDELSVELPHSTPVSKFKQLLGERLGLPARQVKLRSEQGISLREDRVLAEACTLYCSDKHLFILRVRVRVQITRHARSHSVGKYQSCMFSVGGERGGS